MEKIQAVGSIVYQHRCIIDNEREQQFCSKQYVAWK